ALLTAIDPSLQQADSTTMVFCSQDGGLEAGSRRVGGSILKQVRRVDGGGDTQRLNDLDPHA
ncbi:MAG: hypothetical protein ACRDRT_01890, partial [Pseudonocardiaceae bacterium]